MILARSESSCIFTSTHNVETFILPRLAGGGKLGGLMEARGLSTSPTAMGPAMKVVMTETSWPHELRVVIQQAVHALLGDVQAAQVRRAERAPLANSGT